MTTQMLKHKDELIPIEQLINTIDNIKKRKYTEKWTTRLKRKCVEKCDERQKRKCAVIAMEQLQSTKDYIVPERERCRNKLPITNEQIAELIERFNVKHDNKYIYEKSNITLQSSNIIAIKCMLHGSFQVSQYLHLTGRGCLKCRCNDMKEVLYKIHGDLYDYTNLSYSYKSKKIKILCRKHGVFYVGYNSHKIGKICRECALEKNGKEAIIRNMCLNCGRKKPLTDNNVCNKCKLFKKIECKICLLRTPISKTGVCENCSLRHENEYKDKCTICERFTKNIDKCKYLCNKCDNDLKIHALIKTMIGQ